jgi:phosphoribosylanthranilate isomerase
MDARIKSGHDKQKTLRDSRGWIGPLAMAIEVKVCGLTDADAVATAATGGARYLGFVFYPPSPRSLTPARAGELARGAPPACARVGVFVDPDDALLDEVLDEVPLDYLQLHGAETPERVAAIRARTGRGVIKALKIADPEDLTPVPAYAEVADLLMFDARPPDEPGRLPGGNGLAFDWRLLHGLEVARPWLLSGGLSAENLEDAVRLCRARAVDVSSGVELAPGRKDPQKIRRFLELAGTLEPA